MTIPILGLLIIIIFYFLASEFYIVRHLNIKRKRKSAFVEGRKKFYIFIEIILMIFFAIITFTSFDYYPNSPIFRSMPMFIFFTLVYLFRGLEDWMHNKEDKGYYHEWFSSFVLISMCLFLILVEFYSL